MKTGVTTTARINRKDIGLVWNVMIEGGGVLVGDEVSVMFEAELMKKTPAKGGKWPACGTRMVIALG